MNHQRLMGMARTGLRSALLLCFGLGAAGALAYTIHGSQAPSRHHKRPPFTLVAAPRARSITAGATTRYTIAIRRGPYRGRIKLTAAGSRLGLLPARPATRNANKITLKVRRQRVLVTVKTSVLDPAGRYWIKLRATGGKHRVYVKVGLRINAPRPAAFTVGGNLGPLWPGSAQSVNLALTNPNPQGISVRSLVVRITSVSAPRATPTLPCSTADFAVTQFSGAYPLRVPAHAAVHLSTVGVPTAKGPRLVMLDRPVNQDGCQGATVTLSYSGTATSP